MGSGASAESMVISRLAGSTQFEEKELRALAEKFKAVASRHGNPHTITLKDLGECLDEVGIVETDAKLLSKLFTLMDSSGDGQVFFRDFVVCCSSMVSSDIRDNLRFSFSLYASPGATTITHADMVSVLKNSNASASWFGDPTLNADEIKELVDEIFTKHGDKAVEPPQLNFASYLEAVVAHPILVQFITGKGSMKHSASIAIEATNPIRADSPTVETPAAATEEGVVTATVPATDEAVTATATDEAAAAGKPVPSLLETPVPDINLDHAFGNPGDFNLKTRCDGKKVHNSHPFRAHAHASSSAR